MCRNTETLSGDLTTALGSPIWNGKWILRLVQGEAFNNCPNRVSFLGKLLKNGKILYPGSEDLDEAEKHILRVLYTYLIPYTWRRGGYHPVLVQTNVGCDDKGFREDEGLRPKDGLDAALFYGKRRATRRWYCWSPRARLGRVGRMVSVGTTVMGSRCRLCLGFIIISWRRTIRAHRLCTGACGE